MSWIELTPLGMWRELTNPAKGRRKALKFIAISTTATAAAPLLGCRPNQSSGALAETDPQGFTSGQATTESVTPVVSSTPVLSEVACGARINVQDFDSEVHLLKWQELGEGYSHKFGKLEYKLSIDENHENYIVEVENPTESAVPADIRFIDREFTGGTMRQFNFFDGPTIQGTLFIALCNNEDVFVSPTLENRQITPPTLPPNFQGSVLFDKNIARVPINIFTRVNFKTSNTVFSVAPVVIF